jgi:hypothetical protein
MKYVFINVAVLSGLLFFGTPGFAQEHDLGRVLQAVQYDINRVPSVNFQLNEDNRFSLAQTNRDLDKLQQDYAAGTSNQMVRDEAEFQDVIYTLQSAMNDDQVSNRDREILQEDVNLLRGTTYSDTQAFAK